MRNYDYLPADPDALKSEIARLDAELVRAREEADSRVTAAVAAERALLEAQYRTAKAAFEQKLDAFGETCDEIAAAVRAARAHEREACAKLAEETHAELDAQYSPEGCTDTALTVAERIRARS